MQELLVPIDQGPQDADSQEGNARPGGQVAKYRLEGAQAPAVGVHNAQLPGLHGQGLAAVYPEPNEIDHQQPENVQPKDFSLGTEAETGEDDLGKQEADQED